MRTNASFRRTTIIWPLLLSVYVDDLLISSKSMALIEETKKWLKEIFDLKDMGEADCILGMTITRDRVSKTKKLSQYNGLGKVFKTHDVWNEKVLRVPMDPQIKLSKSMCPVTDEEKKAMSKYPYESVVGSLMYAMTSTWPDIAYAIGVASLFSSHPRKEHWDALVRIMRYLKGTID